MSDVVRAGGQAQEEPDAGDGAPADEAGPPEPGREPEARHSELSERLWEVNRRSRESVKLK